MSLIENEKWIDKIVVDMEETLEKNGALLKNMFFSYSPDEITQLGMTEEQFEEAINKCLSLELIKVAYGGKRDSYRLTEEGRARARSCMLCSEKVTEGYNVAVFGNGNNVQLGDNNVQNVTIVLKTLVEQIEHADASSAEKNEAKNLLQKFIEHPLVNTILGLAGNVALKQVGL